MASFISAISCSIPVGCATNPKIVSGAGFIATVTDVIMSMPELLKRSDPMIRSGT